MTVCENASIRSLSYLAEGVWLPLRSGDYATDAERGHDFAEEMLELIARTGNPALFGSVIRAIVEGGRYEGVEVGFCQRLAVTITVMPEDALAVA